MLFVSFLEDFNGKEEILKASHISREALSLILISLPY